MYLTYDKYLEFGGTLDETTFNDFEFTAESVVNWHTFDRLRKMEETDYPVQLSRVMYQIIHLAELKMRVLDNSAGGTVDGDGNIIYRGALMSQANDGVSMSYSVLSASSVIKSADTEVALIVTNGLSDARDSLGRKLLYRGVYPGE